VRRNGDRERGGETKASLISGTTEFKGAKSREEKYLLLADPKDEGGTAHFYKYDGIA